MTARWWHLAIACRVEDADAVAAAIIATTGFAVEEPHPGSISAVAATDVDARRLAAEMAAAFPGLEASVTELEPVDWTVRWRDGIVTRQFGRLVIGVKPIAAARATCFLRIARGLWATS